MVARALWSLARGGASSISVASELCKRTRFRQSDCRECLEICPDNAISLNPGPSIDNSCTECGLCQNACPTEVFRDELHTESYLSDRATSLLGSTGGAEQEATLSIRCHQAVPQVGATLSFPCLGGVGENTILSAALSGFQKVVLIKGDCRVCRLQKGEAQLRDLISSARLLLDGTGFREIPIDLQSRQRNRDSGLARKGLFAVVSDRVRHHAASVRYRRERPGADAPEKGSAEMGSRPSPRRTFLRQLLARVSSDQLREVRRATALRWAEIAIDEGKCSACGTCVAVCPTGALEQATEDGCRILSFVRSACTRCSLCIEACPEDAVVYDEQWSLADLLEDGGRAVARIGLAACVVCGEVNPAAGGEVCTTCEKRGTWQCL